MAYMKITQMLSRDWPTLLDFPRQCVEAYAYPLEMTQLAVVVGRPWTGLNRPSRGSPSSRR
jgi:hypothetical protein